jgi:hypothetical protein
MPSARAYASSSELPRLLLLTPKLAVTVCPDSAANGVAAIDVRNISPMRAPCEYLHLESRW